MKQSFDVVSFVRDMCVCVLVATSLSAQLASAADEPAKAVTGPQTEKRFPPLTVPDGFRATLFACDPLVEYPSVISLGPSPGTLFVAHDYTTGLGVEIVRRDEIRLIDDANNDGYADKSTVYAKGFNSIQGLAFYDGTVFVMHSPLLTSLKDTTGDGVADVRRDLLSGLGLPPEENSNRLHCANGVVAGHDGWLYLAHGDRGCDVKRPEGDRLVFREGGILRCRHDGTDLHVFAGGLRNIYDIALDDELNVFVRDNENDGGTYMIRVCRSFHGSHHGYPYHYEERPAEAMKPLADLGRGSSAGGTAYLETAFPTAYRRSLYFCEWGRAVVRYDKRRSGSGFLPMKEIDFAAGAETDPYGFKPTDLVVDYDGSLLVSDWADGQRPRRGRGRIYRIAPVKKSNARPFVFDPVLSKPKSLSLEKLVDRLDANSYHVRNAAQLEIQQRGKAGLQAVEGELAEGRLGLHARLHAVWILAKVDGAKAIDRLFRITENDRDGRVQEQALRVIADLTDPMLVTHKLDAKRGDVQIARRLVELGKEASPRVRLEIMVTLGRLRWSESPQWLRQYWKPVDDSLAHAAQRLLQRADNWDGVLELLDEPNVKTNREPGLRTVALRALAGRFEESIVDEVLERLTAEPDATRRREYADLLALVVRKQPAWVYWGFRPAPKPAGTVDWSRTNIIEKTLDGLLSDRDRDVRRFALERMQREAITIRLESLADWLKAETAPERVTVILTALNEKPADQTRSLYDAVVTSPTHADANRLAALKSLTAALQGKQEQRLLELASTLEEGIVLAAVLTELGRRPKLDSAQLLSARLAGKRPEVRAAAIAALANTKVLSAGESVSALLKDKDVLVRRAAAHAAGPLRAKNAIPLLLRSATADDIELRRASLLSLGQLGDRNAIQPAVAALERPATQLAALSYLEKFGGAEQTNALAKAASRSRSSDVLAASVRTLAAWENRPKVDEASRNQLQKTIATIQGESGVVLYWKVIGPVSPQQAAELMKSAKDAKRSLNTLSGDSGWQSRVGQGIESAVDLLPVDSKQKDAVWIAVADVVLLEPAEVEFMASSSANLHVLSNGDVIFDRRQPGSYRTDADRFSGKLAAGSNRLVVQLDKVTGVPKFHLRFRTKSSKAEHERLTALALSGRGSITRGQELFLNAEKSQCLQCHRLGEKGGRIGPDLLGIGSRFSRIHLVESILQPSRTIANSYDTLVVALDDGKVISGVKVLETTQTLTIGDNKGKQHAIPKSTIEEINTLRRSTMPDGLEKRLTDREFLDLLAFLQSLKKRAGR